jgi:hypothetical protein
MKSGALGVDAALLGRRPARGGLEPKRRHGTAVGEHARWLRLLESSAPADPDSAARRTSGIQESLLHLAA